MSGCNWIDVGHSKILLVPWVYWFNTCLNGHEIKTHDFIRNERDDK